MVNETCYQSLSLSSFIFCMSITIRHWFSRGTRSIWKTRCIWKCLGVKFGLIETFLKRNNVFKSKAPWKFEKKIGNLSGMG